MTSFNDSAKAGSRAATVISLVAATLISLSTSAQNDDAVKAEMINLAIESTLRKPAAQATAGERAEIASEIENIYLVTEHPRARELASDPRFNATLELQRRVAIYQALKADYQANNAPTEQEIFNEYESQVALTSSVEYKARHILVSTQGAAADLIAQLDEGADFQVLAAEHSSDSSGQAGGDLGWFTEEAMVKPFSDGVKALENGSYSKEPIQSQFGWHVILREDSRDATPPPLDSVRDVIVQHLNERKFQDYVQSLRAGASE